MSIRNLLEETLKILTNAGKTEADVKWVGRVFIEECDNRTDYKTTWEQFKSVAKDISYNGGFGYIEIKYNLIVAGNGWWLERSEYDGAEWWEFKTMPKEPLVVKDFAVSDIYKSI